MDDKEYWTNFYITGQRLNNPSSFAEFIMEYLEEGKNLIDMSCGNGRDTVFFAANNINALGVDQVETEMEYLNKEHENTQNLNFKAGDFTRLDPVDEKYDYIYSRFTFHSISEKKRKELLTGLKTILKKTDYSLLKHEVSKTRCFRKAAN